MSGRVATLGWFGVIVGLSGVVYGSASSASVALGRRGHGITLPLLHVGWHSGGRQPRS
mgnify:CR=1 FL=1